MTEELEASIQVEEAPKKTARVNEILACRGENRQVFRMSDGTEQAVFYPEPISACDTWSEEENDFVGRTNPLTAIPTCTMQTVFVYPNYFQKNLQGKIIGITGKDAHVVTKYSYDVWGIPTIVCDTSECSISTVNPFRYRGYYYDDETVLYYVSIRYYNPNIGRFLILTNTLALIMILPHMLSTHIAGIVL